jgi:hypothetical protein
MGGSFGSSGRQSTHAPEGAWAEGWPPWDWRGRGLAFAGEGITPRRAIDQVRLFFRRYEPDQVQRVRYLPSQRQRLLPLSTTIARDRTTLEQDIGARHTPEQAEV